MSTQGAERSEKIKLALDMKDSSLAQKIRKLDKLNDFYISLLIDIHKVGLDLSAHDDKLSASAEEVDWSEKAAFAQNRMQEDFDVLSKSRDALIRDVEELSESNEILDTCIRINKKAEEEVQKLLSTPVVAKTALEEDYPYGDDFTVDELTEEDECLEIRKYVPEPTQTDVYNAFFVQAAKVILEEAEMQKLHAQAELSVETYCNLTVNRGD
jgi:hypothetical protein